MKTVIRPMPYEVSQFHETEEWLTQKAAEGLHFQDCALGFARLRRGEPKAVRYRLEFAHGFFKPEQEQKALYAELGWEYVATIRHDYFVFRTEDASAPELHTDESVIRKEKRSIFWTQLCLPVTILILFHSAAPDWFTLLRDYGVAYCATEYSTLGLGLILLGFLLLLWTSLRGLRLAVQYQRGVRNKRPRVPLPLFAVSMLLLLTGSLISTIHLHNFIPAGSHAPEELSFPTLAQIDGDAYRELRDFCDMESDPERLSGYWRSGRNFRCTDHYRRRSDPLVSSEALRQELSTYPTREDGYVYPDYAVCYRVQSYRCLTSGLAEGLMETLLSPPDGDRPDWSRLAHDGTATVYTCLEEWNVGEIYQRLLLTDGRRVMTVSYQGERDILAFLPFFEAALAE